MRTKLIALVLSAVLFLPCIVHAEEVEIKLTEVVGVSALPDCEPLDGSDHMGDTPTRPTSFRATINGKQLTVLKRDVTIPSAQVIVVKVSNGSIVLNREFTDFLSERIPTFGAYVIHIQTPNGNLVGQFLVQ